MKMFEIFLAMSIAAAGMGMISNVATRMLKEQCDEACPPSEQKISVLFEVAMFKLETCKCPSREEQVLE